jgi:hypothetical protein
MEMNEAIFASASRWYIDAWCVFDGIVFASESDDRTGQPHLRTVFVTPPYFRPIALANPATALRATRGPFQDRLFNDSGEEIAFDTLDEIIEIARRAYVLGGYNMHEPPTSEMVMPLPRPPDRGAPSGAAAAVLPMLHTVVDARHQEWLAGQVTNVWKSETDRKALQSWCEDYCRWIAVTLAAGTSRRAGKDLREWLQAVGTLFGVETVEAIVGDERLRNRYFRLAFADARTLRQELLDGLLMRLPAARPDGSVGTIGDALALAFSSRTMLESARFEDLLPVLFAGLIIVRATAPPLESMQITTEELRLVAEWFSDGVPRLVTAEHEAAVVFEALVARVVQLGRKSVMEELVRWRDDDNAMLLAERAEEQRREHGRAMEEQQRQQTMRAQQAAAQRVQVRTMSR